MKMEAFFRDMKTQINYRLIGTSVLINTLTLFYLSFEEIYL